MIFDYEKIKESVKNNTDYSKIVPNYYEETEEFDRNRMFAFFLLRFTQRLAPAEERVMREILEEFEINLIETNNGHLTLSDPDNPNYKVTAQMFVNKHENIALLPQNLQMLVIKKRYGNCHSLAMDTANNWKFPCSLVTSLVLNADEMEHAVAMVHSYVVVEVDEMGIVFDPTFNLVMKKAEYDNLFQTVELTKIDQDLLKDDVQYLMEQFGGAWNPKIYCLFPKEYMEEMRKKNHSRR